MGTTMLKPGLLVSLSARLDGGVTYFRKDLTPEGSVAEPTTETEVSRWETTKVVEDKEEHDRATKLRSALRRQITKICTETAFGLLCPKSSETDLDQAIAEVRTAAASWNAAHPSVRLSVYVLKAQIAESDSEAARAIASELRDLLDQMRKGILACDAEAIRTAATKARQMGAMLDEATGKRVTEAIADARKAAREIVKRVETGGEDAATVAAELEREHAKTIDSARFAFLDFDEPVAAPTESAAPVAVEIDEPVAEGGVSEDNGGEQMAATAPAIDYAE